MPLSPAKFLHSSLLFDFGFPDGLLNRILQQQTGIQNILISFITSIPRVLANQVYFSPSHFQLDQDHGSIMAPEGRRNKRKIFQVGERTIN